MASARSGRLREEKTWWATETWSMMSHSERLTASMRPLLRRSRTAAGTPAVVGEPLRERISGGMGFMAGFCP